MGNIKVLLVGKENYADMYELPEYIELTYLEKVTEPDKNIYDIVILDRDVMYQEREILQKCTRAYGLFITENARINSTTKKLFDNKVGKRLYTGDVNEFFVEEAPKYYDGSYGEKLVSDFITVNKLFAGRIHFDGGHSVQLSGNYGDDYKQIIYWKYNMPLQENQTLDLFLEYSKSENVHIKLHVIQFYSGSVGEIQQSFEFGEEELDSVIQIHNKLKKGPMFFSILAKGEGDLNIIALHDRYSRFDIGYFIPGGERFVTSKGEEAFMYFDPGDMQPPLAVYFSGYRTQEGFEGYYMMRSLGCPMLLITDPRLEGGAFYLGDEEYENMITDAIKGYMKRLGFASDKLILSGLSMGTFGSLYYGCKLEPHALILGKPLANMGNVAKNERIERPGKFPTSMDVLLKNYGELTDKSVDDLNQRLWKRFDKANWSNSKFIVAYLYEDDYDPTGYPDILKHLKDSGVEVYGKGTHGHHNDNSNIVIQWFKSQYDKVLLEDFGRRR